MCASGRVLEQGQGDGVSIVHLLCVTNINHISTLKSNPGCFFFFVSVVSFRDIFLFTYWFLVLDHYSHICLVISLVFTSSHP